MTTGTPDPEGETQFQKSSSADPAGAKKRGLLSRIHTFDSLSIRDFRLLWLGQVGTSLGQWMDNISRTYLIYHITSSPLQLGLAAAARGIPLFLFGIVAGALADRSGRKTQLIVAQVTNSPQLHPGNAGFHESRPAVACLRNRLLGRHGASISEPGAPDPGN